MGAGLSSKREEASDVRAWASERVGLVGGGVLWSDITRSSSAGSLCTSTLRVRLRYSRRDT